MKQKSKPKPIVIQSPDNGNITVKIYRVQANSSLKDGTKVRRIHFQVADYSSGKRKLRTFADEQEARAAAAKIATQLARGDVAAHVMTNRDATDYLHSVELVKPTGIALPIAARHFAEAVKILGGDLVIEAAKYYQKRHAKIAVNKSVTEVYDMLIADAHARKLSDRYIQDLEHRAGKFADAFQCPIAAVSADDVRGFLAGLRTTRNEDGGKGTTSHALSGRSHNNYLGAINRLFEFAKARRLLPFDHDDLSGIEPVKDKGGEIEIYSTGEIDRLLQAADDDILPVFVIGAFAGLRSAEIERLDWSEVNLAERFIEVKAGKAKTASRRVVPITDNLATWLTPIAQKSGLVWELGHAYFHQRLREVAAATGSATVEAMKLKDNGLRHSFISYRVAQTQNVNQVALEAGNSPTMIFQHYRELVTRKQADVWFSIVPSGDEEMPTLQQAEG